MELILENVRCFAGMHKIPIRPLTILVGENSSGKSTLLAALSVMCNNGFPLSPELNEPPYNLGNFQTIATHEGEKNRNAPTFSLGFKDGGAESSRTVTATYTLDRRRTSLSELLIERPEGTAALRLLHDAQKYEIKVNPSQASQWVRQKFTVPVSLNGVSREPNLLQLFLDRFSRGDTGDKAAFVRLQSVVHAFSKLELTPAVSIAPIRTKPKRTYDEVAKEYSPEGDHIPLLLARILGGGADSEGEESLLTGLRRFGEESGLFKDIEIRNLGDQPGDPFQVLVMVADRPANLLDVGYGVSQALPVVVESILAADGNLLLLQQPEVHLHPRAQAALGSFFVDMVVQHDKRFVLETHSDYIVDRIRMEIADGKLPSDAFMILYLERHGTETTVYPITVDSLGNLLDVPPTYREFFLREAVNLLSRGN
jgi:energy-coupling factor transporter ATP-binding protein EcfA2